MSVFKKRLQDLKLTVLVSLFASLFLFGIFLSGAKENLIERELTQFNLVTEILNRHMINAVLLAQLTEEKLEDYEYPDAIQAYQAKSGIYIHRLDDKTDLQASEVVALRMMSSLVDYMPVAFSARNFNLIFRSYSGRKMLMTKHEPSFQLTERAFTRERCEETGACTKYASKRQLEDRLVISPVYQDAITGLNVISIVSPVYVDNVVVGDFIVDIYLRDSYEINSDRISLDIRGAYKVNVIEDVSYPLADFAYVKEFIADNNTMFVYKIPFSKLFVDYAWLFGLLWSFTFIFMWKMSELKLNRHQLAYTQRRVNRDDLTGLYNRSVFKELHFKTAISQLPVSVLAIDGDNIKQVNDVHGHHVGDEVIKHIADTMKESFRDTDYLVRTGGDEFIVVLPNCPITVSQRLCQQLTHKVSQLPVTNADLRVNISVGCVEMRLRESLADAIKRADAQLYVAKRNRQLPDVVEVEYMQS
ncbi:sensor domain-containing diguanylate cyclase [Vibrio agarivorans]|uniref:sensor domain-containing diguanylate cyclase n=1 Tax=Vibrio agarivorans TaxID=153622 RepID=UPI0025B4ECB6|nr:diguanylate cyclase [Vibrio agarivorans]MDN3661461.1 diguanylate cyclase [Vibrio agarivorans]